VRAAAAPRGGAGGGGVAGAREISRVCVWGLGAATRRAMRLGGGNAQPPELWRWARDELKLAIAPLPGAPNVMVWQTTAGWRNAPA